MAHDPLNTDSPVRTFLAIPLAGPFGMDIERIIRKMSTVTENIKWIRPEQVHLTLHFFGTIHPEKIETIRETLAPIAAGTGPLVLGINEIGCFPNPIRPKIIWLGITGDITRLQTLHQSIETNLEQQGFPCEERHFKPHATIGRVRSNRAVKFPATVPSPPASPELRRFDHMILYQSRLLSDGPRYEPLETFLFAAQ
jgi:2'-5' RNA ligase